MLPKQHWKVISLQQLFITEQPNKEIYKNYHKNYNKSTKIVTNKIYIFKQESS